MEYLIDTNIIIYYFNGNFTSEQKSSIDKILKTSLNLSIISKIKFLGCQQHTEESYNLAKEFLDSARIFELNELIANKTIEIKRLINIKLPDAIIAATALINKLKLVTRNEKDFKNLQKLSIVNPYNQK